MISATDWIPAIVMLACGLIVGFMLIRHITLASRSATGATASAAILQEQESALSALVERLSRSPLSAQERLQIELDAARTLQTLDRLRSVAGSPQDVEVEPYDSHVAPAVSRRSPVGRLVWITGTIASIGFLLFLAAQFASKREQPVNTSAPPSGPADASSMRPGPPAAETQSLEAKVQREPENVEARLDLAYSYLINQDLLKVYEHTQYVLAKTPEHPRALTYQAIVQLAMGRSDEALRMVTLARKGAPEALEPLVHLAIIHMRRGEAKDASRAIEQAIREHPQERQKLTALHAEMKQSAAQFRETPPESGKSTTGPSTNDKTSIVVEIHPGSGVKVAPLGGKTLFVIARQAGVASGPPIAAARQIVSSWPVRVELGAQQSMLGQQLPASLRIEARIDSDGDPLTRNADDPRGSVDNAALGSKVELRIEN